jgi:hypothetical protein
LAGKVIARALYVVDRRARQFKRQDANHPQAKARVNFGLYFYGMPGPPADEEQPVTRDKTRTRLRAAIRSPATGRR